MYYSILSFIHKFKLKATYFRQSQRGRIDVDWRIRYSRTARAAATGRPAVTPSQFTHYISLPNPPGYLNVRPVSGDVHEEHRAKWEYFPENN